MSQTIPPTTGTSSPLTSATPYQLHDAIIQCQSEDIIFDLIEQNPTSVRQCYNNQKGMYPLCLACIHMSKKTASFENVVERLLDPIPCITKVDDNECTYPLHIVLSWSFSNKRISGNVLLSVIESAHPPVFVPIKSDGMYPLHIACQAGHSEAVILKLLEIHPSANKKTNKRGDYPVHLFVSQLQASCANKEEQQQELQANTHVIKCLLETNLNAIDSRLLQLYPRAAQIKNSTSNEFPLHVALSVSYCFHNQPQPQEQYEEFLCKLIDLFPQACKERNQQRMYPLHIACQSHHSETVILKLLLLYPDANLSANANDKYPIHLFLSAATAQQHKHTQRQQESNRRIIQQLIETNLHAIDLRLIRLYPGAARIKNSILNEYPLHVASSLSYYRNQQRHQQQQYEELLFHLIDLFPQGCREQNQQGMYPLHIACQNTYVSEPVLLTLMNAFPQAIQHKTNDDLYPLHLACRCYQSVSIIFQLLDVFSEAARHKDIYGNYPLIYSYGHKESETVVHKLLDVFPDASQHKDNYGHYPIHIACQTKQSVNVVLKLLEVFADGVQQQSINGWYPLHCACRYNQSEAVILHLLKIYPEAATYKTSYNSFPLHYACGNNQSDLVVVKLLETFPDAVQQKTRSDEYPLHRACATNAHLSIIKLLVVHFPDALVCIDSEEKKTPLDWALRPKQGRNTIAENVEFLQDAMVNYQQQSSYHGSNDNKKTNLNL